MEGEPEPIPEHVQDAVLAALKANDLSLLDSLSPEDNEAAKRYLTSLAAYAKQYPRHPEPRSFH